MIATDQIRSDLKKIIAELLKLPSGKIDDLFRPDALLNEDLGIDSAESLDFLQAVEDFYSIRVSDKEVEKLVAVSDVIDLIAAKRK